jgi:hypothetical protein
MADTLVDDPKAAARAARAERLAERRVARLAKQIDAFAQSHGGGAEATVEYIGEIGTRIVLVGENGEWGDLVAPTYELAQRAVERSGVTVHEDFDGDFAAKIRTGPYEWKRMAGIQIGSPTNT